MILRQEQVSKEPHSSSTWQQDGDVLLRLPTTPLMRNFYSPLKTHFKYALLGEAIPGFVRNG